MDNKNTKSTQRVTYNKDVNNLLSTLNKAVKYAKENPVLDAKDENTVATPAPLDGVKHVQGDASDMSKTTLPAGNLSDATDGVTGVTKKKPVVDDELAAKLDTFNQAANEFAIGTDNLPTGEAGKGNTQPVVDDSLDGMKSASNISNVANVITGINVDNTQLLAKVASSMLATEQGRYSINAMITSGDLNPEIVNNIKTASAGTTEEIEMNQNLINRLHTYLANLSPEDQDRQLKTASTHTYNLESFGENIPMRAAYNEGVKYAQAMMEEAPLPESDVMEDEQAQLQMLGAAIEEMIASGEINEEQGAALFQQISEAAVADGNADLSEEEFMMALQQGMDSGEITPEVAEALQAQFYGDAGVGGEEAGALPPEVDPAVVGDEVAMGKIASAIEEIADEGDIDEVIEEEGIGDEGGEDLDVEAVVEAISEMSDEEAEEVLAQLEEEGIGNEGGDISQEEIVDAIASMSDEEAEEVIAQLEEEGLGDDGDTEVDMGKIASAIEEIADEGDIDEVISEGGEGLGDEGGDISSEELVEAISEMSDEEAEEVLAQLEEEGLGDEGGEMSEPTADEIEGVLAEIAGQSGE